MMNDNFYEEKLTHFKENEQPEVVLLIADEPQLIKIVVAWTNIRIRRAKQLSSFQDDSDTGVWEWLWKNTVYAREELISKSAVPEHGFDRRMTTLIGNRVLYPDGTVNSFVQRYLRDRVLKLFEAKLKRNSKKT